MNEAQPETPPQDPRVQAALRDYLERVDQGEDVDRDAYLEQHADVADELRSFINTEEQLRQLAAREGDPQPSAENPKLATRSFAEHNQETISPQWAAVPSPEAGNQPALPEQFGRYRVLRPLGSGAMGVVYLAEDTQLERQVALKTPTFENDESGELLERFYREAKSAATLRHPNICPVFDVGEIDGHHYISMAYIEGRPLSGYIRPDKPQPERQILILVRKLALALMEAHTRGIIHRDLKPSNIMVDARGEPVIMDFGLARNIERDDASRLTQLGTIIGSPAYMSPEQVEGVPENITPATDQYSLGVVLYELLTSQLPFRGSVTGVIGQILTKEPPSLREHRPDVDPRIEAACLKMMAKSAADRFGSMKATADALTAILKDDAPSPTADVETSQTASEQPRRSKKGSAKTTASAAAQSAAASSVSKSNVASMVEAARKCMAIHDYEQVIQMLEKIPGRSRTDTVYVLLERARELADEVTYLLAELDEAVRMREDDLALKKADELLKIKPGHHRAKQVKKELTAPRRGDWWPLSRKHLSRKCQSKKSRSAKTTSLLSRSMLLTAVAVLVAIGLTWAVVTLVLKTESGTVEITFDEALLDEDIAVIVDGKTFRIENLGKPITITPGKQTLIIQRDGLELVTKKFTLKKNGKIALWVTLVGDDVKVLDAAPEKIADGDPVFDRGKPPSENIANKPPLPALPDGPPGEIKRFTGHPNHVIDVTFSPDGRHFYSAGRDKAGTTFEQFVWDLQSGERVKLQRRNLNVEPYGLFSPSGDALYNVGYGGLRKWDTTSGARMAIFLDGKRFFSLSPDGKHLVSGGRDKAVTIWDVKSQGLIHQWPDLGEQVFDVAYSPDGRRVIACIRHNRKNRVIVWDANTHKEISNVRTDSGKAQFMPVISPDGKLVAYNHFKAPNFIWDIENRREHGWLKGHTGETRGIAFSGDSKYILTGGGDMTVRFWDVKTQEQLFSEQLDFSPMGVSLSADGRYGLVAAGEWYSGDGWHSDGHGDIRLYRLPIGE